MFKKKLSRLRLFNYGINRTKVLGLNFLLIVVLHSFSSCAISQKVKGESLISGKATLTVNTNGINVSISSLGDSTIDFRTNESLCLNLLDGSDSTMWLTGAYSSVILSGNSLICTGEIQTTSGSVFHFNDIYSTTNTANSFVLSREIIVTSAKNDTGFLSRFSLRSSSNLRAHDFLFQVSVMGITARPGRGRWRQTFQTIISSFVKTECPYPW